MCSFIQNETPHIIDSCKIILLKSYREVQMFFRAPYSIVGTLLWICEHRM